MQVADELLALALAEGRAGRDGAALTILHRLGTFDLPVEAVDSLQLSSALSNVRSTEAGRLLLATWRSHLTGLRGTAFQVGETDTIPMAARLAGLSLIWAEVRFAGAGVVEYGIGKWDSLYAATIDSVAQTSDTWRYYLMLMKFAAALGDGHTDVRPPSRLTRRHWVGVPISVGRMQGRFVVQRVRSRALRDAGVAVGDEIIAINRIPVEQYAIDSVRRWFTFSTQQARDRQEAQFLFIGDSGTTLDLVLRGEGAPVKTVRVARLPYPDAERVVVPPVVATFTSDGILHLRVNTFGVDSVGVLAERMLLREPRPRAVVLDLRANGGGSQDPGWRILSHFLRDTLVLREQYSRSHVATLRAWGVHAWYTRLPVRKVAPASTGRLDIPIITLTGPATGSAAEGVVAVYRQADLGFIVGEPTAGSTGQPLVLPLPGGGSFRVRTEDERYSDGTAYIGRGIVPDIHVSQSVRGLLEGRDEALDSAITLLRQQLATQR